MDGEKDLLLLSRSRGWCGETREEGGGQAGSTRPRPPSSLPVLSACLWTGAPRANGERERERGLRPAPACGCGICMACSRRARFGGRPGIDACLDCARALSSATYGLDRSPSADPPGCAGRRLLERIRCAGLHCAKRLLVPVKKKVTVGTRVPQNLQLFSFQQRFNTF
jgi:hypothetical protein